MSEKLVTSSVLMVGLIILALFLSSCSGQVTAGRGEQGRTVTIKAGETLLVTLDSNPTTGYSWQVAEVNAAVLKQKGEPEYKQSPGSQGLAGAGGTETFRFEAVAAGKTTLTLVYVRPWEKDTPPTDTYSITVIVE